MLPPWKKSYNPPRQHIKNRDTTLPTKVHLVKAMDVWMSCHPSSHVWMWELDFKESWAPKNWCFWTVVLEKTLESPLDCKEIQPVHLKGNHIGRTDAETETPIHWPPVAKIWLIWKDPDAGKDWRREEMGWLSIDDYMASPTRWHKFE